jgi:hypothetical protein
LESFRKIATSLIVVLLSINAYGLEAQNLDLVEKVSEVQNGVTVVNLLNLYQLREQLGMGESPLHEAYDRLKHFGTWVKPEEGKCYNTRAVVLIRDDESNHVTFGGKSNCSVVSGKWNDEYTGTIATQASVLQIDHFIPLKNAFDAGAWKWTYAERCTFANYIKDPGHLKAVSGHENESKGDLGPEGYLPPDEADRCDYVQNWLRIKASWNLEISHAELTAITATQRKYNCSKASLSISLEQLKSDSSHEVLPACAAKKI